MDLVLGQFADSQIDAMSDTDLDTYEALLEVPDPEVFKWITQTVPVPANYDTDILHRIRAFHVELPAAHRD